MPVIVMVTHLLNLVLFIYRNVQSCDACTMSSSLNTRDAGTLSSSRIDVNESIYPSKTRSVRSTKVVHRLTPSTTATQTSFIPEVR